MLILSRQHSESIQLGDDIKLTVVAISGDKVRIGVEAPPGVRILRKELDKPAKVDSPKLSLAERVQQRRAA